MKKAYIGIGSNLGDKLKYCQEASDRIINLPGCRLNAESSYYRTEPVGVEGQDWFINGVVCIETDLPATGLLENLLSIEADMGRKRKKKWDARTIDLDILLFGEDIIHEPDLTVPHPLMHVRRFVLIPMVELSPDLRHPLLHKTMLQLLASLPEKEQPVFPLGEK